jgi:Rieske Fe-S protein
MVSRRHFMKYLGVLAGTLLACPARWVRAGSLQFSLEKVEKLQSIGGSVILKIKGKDILFIRDTETTVRALDPACTHKGCIVTFNKATKRIECPCHQSVYDMEGRVLAGPAPRGLKNYDAELKDQKILFSLD